MKAVLFFVAAVVSSVFANELAVEGIENCPNKCEKVFDKTQYKINDQPNQSTFEYRSCLLGCSQCQTELESNTTNDKCLDFCKNYNYKKAGIRKGVIEPDKACMIGCVINTCQEVCLGGTTDKDITPANQNLWWGQGGNGCSIKTGLGYVQNPNYANPNAPVGQPGDEKVQQCCTNALNLCYYVGNKNSVNYQNVQVVTKNSCKAYVTPYSEAKVCEFYNNAQNCGTQGMSGI